MKTIKEIPVNTELINYIERLSYEYNTRKDILSSIFELHRFDEDGSVIEGAPFKHYEKLFVEAKVAYDQAMEEVQNTIVPEEYRKPCYMFEVSFDDEVVRIKEND